MSVMTSNMGLMQMGTIVFTPVQKDLPLLSCDYLYMLANRSAYVELYDLLTVKDDVYQSWLGTYAGIQNSYDDLTDADAKPAWYDELLTVVCHKRGTMADDERLRGLLLDMVNAYLQHADASKTLSAEARTAKLDLIKAYSDRLIREGGISTDFFKQSLGEEQTRSFFDQVFFGTQGYR